MTDDCVCAVSVGPEPGRTWRGRDAVRAGAAAMFDRNQTDRAEISSLFIVDDRAAWEWRYFASDGASET